MQQRGPRGRRSSTPTGNRQRSTPIAAWLVAALVLLALAPPAHAAPEDHGHVRGEVLSRTTKAPIAGATVFLPHYGVRTTSRDDGSFLFARPLPTDRPYRRIEAVVTAPGWGSWRIRGVPLYPSDTLRLHVELRREDSEHAVLTPTERRARVEPLAGVSSYDETCTGWKHQGVPPRTIRVLITEEEQAERYDFVFYATHVLPNEWLPHWDADALGAGAIAVKTYGAYRAMPGHAYSGGEGCADVVDTGRDQVFDPTWSTAATDQAVYAALGSILLKNGGLFLAQHNAGEPECRYFDGRMSQWGTEACAADGMLWPEITTFFYRDTTWKHLKNLILNSNVESAATYAWSWTGTATRVKGGSYLGQWHWRLSPPPSGASGVLRQRRPWNGTPSTTYRSSVALRCGRENAEECRITIRVSVLTPGGRFRSKARTITEANDGKWRRYTFYPDASGYDHVAVKLVVASRQTIGVDAAVLKTTYGGS